MDDTRRIRSLAVSMASAVLLEAGVETVEQRSWGFEADHGHLVYSVYLPGAGIRNLVAELV
jgi:hypothetical protein